MDTGRSGVGSTGPQRGRDADRRPAATVNDKIKEEGQRFADFLSSAPQTLIDEGNLVQRAEADSEHREFKEAYDQGKCYLCRDTLTSFNETNPCAHWLLNPVGFRKKKHFLMVTEKYGFHQLQGFLRWVGKEDHFLGNINDLPDEGTGKLREVTIRYKDFEWSFMHRQ
jgi:hypothetical protein